MPIALNVENELASRLRLLPPFDTVQSSLRCKENVTEHDRAEFFHS
jgi:hypothetical protein